MTQQFDCLIEDCDFTARGETEDELMMQIEQHRQGNHPQLDVSEEEIRRNIRTI
ncbi:DUF1059 domain-containing protein [Halocatena marina]|uniref:DUF1059 domain-containing protein n=1 Tax=Halocatena marina TaxID=2934937 RepID=A0ABD5YIU4_9EURY|nr:DUF1059 domain-containing protein [Halocatena marina]